MLTDLEDIIKIHDQACEERRDMFVHPDTGFSVMTRRYLSKRKCCGNKCMFCPYKHVNVKGHRCSEKSCPIQH